MDVTLTPRTTSECSQSPASGTSSQDLSDILVLPKPKDRSSSKSGVNHDAVCITDTEFIEQIKLKELEKQKKQEEAEQKRIKREQKRIEREQKRVEKEQKAEKEASKGWKKKGRKTLQKKGKGAEPVEKSEQSNCEYPICGIDFGNDEENVRWIGCDGCLRWWHVACFDLTEIPVDFVCSDCQ